VVVSEARDRERGPEQETRRERRKKLLIITLSVTRISLAVLLSSWIPPILLYLRSVDYSRKSMVNLQPTNREGNSPLTSSCPSSFHVVIVLHPLPPCPLRPRPLPPCPLPPCPLPPCPPLLVLSRSIAAEKRYSAHN
jgi:hypothetical protein